MVITAIDQFFGRKRLRCPICEADLTVNPDKKEKNKKNYT
jgi:hypothetical protein